MESGADAFRVNASHLDTAAVGELTALVRRQAPDSPVVLDLGGPKVRLGEVALGSPLAPGQGLTWHPEGAETTDASISFGDEGMGARLSEGARVALADGRFVLRVASAGATPTLEVERSSGELRRGAGVTLPSGALGDRPILSAKDLADLEAGLEAGATAVAASFVRGPEDVGAVREAAAAHADPVLMAKIERPEAVERLEETVGAADMVMVARGDLGASLGLESVPGVQERIVRTARAAVVGVVLATEVLESMVHAESPTRAEVMDIDAAVLQGVDMVCLSAETAIGDHPDEAVAWLARILERADARHGFDVVRAGGGLAEHIGAEAADLAAATGAGAFLVVTRSGFSARNVARHRVAVPVLAVVAGDEAARRVRLLRGVWPVVAAEEEMNARLRLGVRELLARSWIGSDDLVVGALGLPHEGPGGTSGIFLLRASRA